MASAVPAMTVLPQYQGTAYQLQQQQALAQALMQHAMTPQNTQAVGSGQYSIVPKYSIGGGMAQLGQALLAAKMQNNVGQGYQDLGQNQMNYLMGGTAPAQSKQAAAPQAAAPQQTTDAGGMTDNQSGPGVTSTPVPTPGQPTPQAYASALGATGSSAPTPAAAPAQGGGMLAPGSALNPSGMDSGKAAYLYMTMGPAEYAKNFVAPYVKPTEATLMANQAHSDPIAANRDALFKANNIAPYQFAPNTVVQDPRSGASSTTPAAAPAGSQNILGADNKWYTVPVQGGSAAIQAEAAAKAGGEGSMLPYDKGVDAAGNPLPVMSRTAAATQQAGATTPASAAIVQTESGGNPNAVSPKGAMGAWQVMPNTNANPGFGVKPAQNNSPAELNRVGQDYYNAMTQRYQSPTLGAIAYNMGPGATDQWIKNGAKFESLPAETRNYVGKVATLTALNSGAGTTPSAPSTSAGIYAAPPMGAQANVEATVKGQIDTMQKSYQNLQTVRSGAPAALQDVDNMSKLAQGANPLTIGPAGAKFAGLFSSNAAEYEKSRDNLVTNLGSQLGINSDAARDLVYGSIPSYGSPKQAVQNGLDTLRGQIQTRLLKSDYLSGAYASGDAKAYNQKENQFDQNMTPAVANQVSTFNSMPTGPAKAQALKAAASNPQLRQRLEWAVSNGILK